MQEAEKFIEALTGDSETPVTFQTFDDRGVDKSLTHVMHGPLSYHILHLKDLNERGAGVFMAINETDLCGRKESNIIRPRALFVDLDNGSFNGASSIFSCVVNSGHGEHGYFFLDQDQPLNSFTDCQKKLASIFHGDEKVSDLSRVMRIPGFMNNKDSPLPVYIKNMTNSRFTYRSAIRRSMSYKQKNRIEKYMAAIPPAIEGSGGDAQTYKAACALIRGFALSEEEAMTYFERWNQTCLPPWEEGDLRAKLAHAKEYGKGDIGYLLDADLNSDGDEASIIGFKSIVSDMSGCWDRMRTRIENKGLPVGLRTGYKALDALTGGLSPGGLYIVAGTTSIGKTAFALNLTANVARNGLKVGVFSLEMSISEVVDRIVYSEARMGRDQVINDKATEPIQSAITDVSSMGIYVDDSFNITPDRMIERVKSLGKVDLVVVDYIQLVNSGIADTRVSREREVGSISRALKQMAKECQCAVVGLSQLNRNVDHREGGKPRLSDLRESGSLEQDADAVIFLCRNKWGEGEKRFQAEGILAKQRNGPIGSFYLNFTPDYARFEDPSEAHDRWEEDGWN